MEIKDALQLMMAFGMFVLTFISVVISIKKK